MLYTKDQTNLLHEQTFDRILVTEKDHVLTITLNHPESQNALSTTLVYELGYALSFAHHTHRIWAVVLEARGEVFCSGFPVPAADAALAESKSTIPEIQETVNISELFRKLHKPCIANVGGNVYSDGFLLLSGSTYVVACNDIKLSLPDASQGRFPFQVMASLLEVAPTRKVLDWCIRAYNLEVEQALEWGLVTHVTIQERAKQEVDDLLSHILKNSPTAIRMGLEAYDYIRRPMPREQFNYLEQMLQKSLDTQDAQEGLTATTEKRSPHWTGE